MSSFSGWACFDLLPEQAVEVFLQAVRELPDEENDEVNVLVRGQRVFLLWARSPVPLAMGGRDLVPGAASRALMALDWDDYGVEHCVLGTDGKPVHIACVDEQGSGMVELDTAESRRTAAELYGADPAALDEVSRTWKEKGTRPSVLGEPYLLWWTALGVPWPDDFVERSQH